MLQFMYSFTIYGQHRGVACAHGHHTEKSFVLSCLTQKQKKKQKQSEEDEEDETWQFPAPSRPKIPRRRLPTRILPGATCA